MFDEQITPTKRLNRDKDIFVPSKVCVPKGVTCEQDRIDNIVMYATETDKTVAEIVDLTWPNCKNKDEKYRYVEQVLSSKGDSRVAVSL